MFGYFGVLYCTFADVVPVQNFNAIIFKSIFNYDNTGNFRLLMLF